MATIGYSILALVVGSFIAGPGFGLAGAMVVWFVLKYKPLVWQRFVGQRLSAAANGIMITLTVVVADVLIVYGLQLLTTGMGR